MFFMVIDDHKKAGKFRELYGKYSKLAYTTAYGILKDRADAEDVVQQSFIKVLENIERFDEKICHNPEGLIVIFSRNTAIDLYRKRQRSFGVTDYLDEIAEVDLGKVTDCADIIIQRETLNEVKDIIKGLSKIYRDVFIMKRVYGYSNDEIAEYLKISNATVRQRLSRARKMIDKEVEKRNKNGKTE